MERMYRAEALDDLLWDSFGLEGLGFLCLVILQRRCASKRETHLCNAIRVLSERLPALLAASAVPECNLLWVRQWSKDKHTHALIVPS